MRQIGTRISNVLKIITYDTDVGDNVGDKVGLDGIEGLLEGWVDGEEDISFFRRLWEGQ